MSTPQVSLRVGRLQKETLLGLTNICSILNTDKLWAGLFIENENINKIQSLFWRILKSNAENKLSDNYNISDKCHDPISSESPGEHLPQVGVGKGKEEGMIFPGKKKHPVQNEYWEFEYYIMSLNLQVFWCRWHTECKWECGQKWD